MSEHREPKVGTEVNERPGAYLLHTLGKEIPVCPHCFEEQAWAADAEEFEECFCRACGGEFDLSIVVVRTYTTYRRGGVRKPCAE